jgi:hypothetical protein
MVAPFSNLSPYSLGHMVGPREFFMSLKEKGLKLFQRATMFPREKGA